MKIQQAFFSSMLNKLTQEVDTIMCDVQDLKNSMNCVRSSGTMNKETFSSIQGEIPLIKGDILKRNTINKADTEKLLENSKTLVEVDENNLRIDGIKTHKGETWKQCE